LQAKADQVSRGGARAAVLGVNDGLVSNLALILGVAGASATAGSVRVAGFASLVAGAFSMAAGEWVSVKAQVDLFTGVLAEIRRLLTRNPKLVLDALAAKLVETGFDDETARKAAAELPLDSDRFFAFTARTVFGVNSEELGSPRTAALSSLGFFALGAIVPLAPWFLTQGTAASLLSILLTGVASIVVGTVIARSSGTPRWRGAVRQLVIVAAAAAVTWGIGALVGTAIG
jgi:vacuolar iron transporter family protein